MKQFIDSQWMNWLLDAIGSFIGLLENLTYIYCKSKEIT